MSVYRQINNTNDKASIGNSKYYQLQQQKSNFIRRVIYVTRCHVIPLQETHDLIVYDRLNKVLL